MAKDLRILLGADLDLSDVNKQIHKLSETVLNLKVNLDLKGLGGSLDAVLSNAGKGFGKNIANTTKANMQKIYDDLKKEATAIQAALGKDTKVSTSIQKNGSGNIVSATQTYSDQLGRTMQKNYGWDYKEVNGQIERSWKLMGSNLKENSAKVANEMDRLISKVEKIKYNLASGTTKIFDQTQLANVISEYDKITRSIEKARNAGTQWGKDSSDSIERLIKKQQQLTGEIQKQQKEQIRQANLGRTQIGDLGGLNLGTANLEDVKKLYQKQLSAHTNKDVKMDNISVDSVTQDNSGKWVAKLSATVEEGKNKMMKYKSTMDEASNSTRIFGERVLTTATRNLGFMEKLRVAMQSIPIWMVGMTAFYQTLHFFTDGMKFVNGLNESLTQLSIVFNQSQEEVSKYNKQFHDLAMEMSLTTDEVAKGSVEFARQGLGQTQMIERMKTAAVYSKISNIDLNESSKILTATINSMGVTAAHAADIFSYMGDATATGADEIGRAMQRVGGTAGAVGLSFEKLASWIAVVSSRTREGSETIGNAFKSILARYQSIKETGFNQEDGTNFNQVTKALSNVGIAAVDSKNQLRNFGDIMDDLGAKWNSLDKNQQAYIATTVAGTYQQSRFLNIMEGYGDSVKLYEKSLGSAGIALQKFDRFQDGTEAHLNKLKTAWTGIFQDSFDSTGIRTLIDALTKLATTFDFVVQNIGLMPIALTGLTAVLMFTSGAFKKFYLGLGKDMVSGIVNAKTNITSLIARLDLLYTTLGAGGIAARGFSIAIAGLKAGIVSLASAVLPLLGMIAIGYIFEKIATAMTNAKEAAKKLKQEIDQFDKSREKVSKLANDFKDLSNATNGGKNFADAKQEQDYYDTAKNLSNILPSLIQKIDEKGNVHLKNADAIQREIDHLTKLADQENAKTLSNANITSKKYANDISSAQKELDVRTTMLGVAEKAAKAYPDRKIYQDQLIEAQTNVENAQYKLDNVKDQLTSFYADLANIQINKSGADFGDKAKEQIDKIVRSLDVKNPEQSMKTIKSIIDKYSELQKLLNAPSSTKDQSAIDKVVQSLKIELGQISGVNVEEVTKAMTDAADSTKNATEKIVTYGDALKSVEASYTSSADKLSILNGLLDDNAKGKRLSADEVAKLVAKDAEMVDMFKIENGQIVLNKEAIKAKTNEMITAFGKEAEAQRIALINQNKALLDKLDMYQLEIDGISSVSDQLDIVNKKYGDMYQAQQTAMQDAGIEGPAFVPGWSETVKLVKNLDNLKKQAALFSAGLKTVGQDKSNPSDNSNSSPKPYDAANTKAYKIDIEQINAEIKGQEQLLTTLDNTSQAYRDGLQKEIVLQEKKKNAAHENAADLRAQKSSLEGQIAAMGNFNSLSDENKTKMNDLRKQLDDTTKSIDDMSNSWWDAFGKVNELSYAGIESALAEFEMKIKGVDNAMEESQAQQGIYKEDSKQWTTELFKQIEAMKQKQELLHQEAELIREKIKNDNLNSEQIRTLTEKARQLSLEWLKLEQNINSSQESLMSKRNQAADEVINYYKDMLGKQKEMMDNAYDDQLKSMDKAHQAEMDAVDETQKGYERLIETKKKAYDKEGSDRKYNQDLAKKQQEQQDVQNSVNALSMDNSAEGQSKLRDLKKKLTELNTDISNMQQDHSNQVKSDALDTEKQATTDTYELNKKNLDKIYQDKKDAIDKEKKLNDQALDAMINDDQAWAKIRKQMEEGHVKDVIAGLGQIQSTWEAFVTTKATSLSADLKKNLFDKGISAIADWQQRLDTLKESISNLGYAGSGGGVSFGGSDSGTPTTVKSGDGSGTSSNGGVSNLYVPIDEREKGWIKKMEENSKNWFTATDKKKLEDDSKMYAGWLGATKDSNDEWTKNGLRLFHKGGVVGGKGNGITNLINKMFNANPNEQVIMALEDELMAPSQNIVKNFMPNLGGLVSRIASKQPSVATGNGDLIIQIASVTGDKKGAELVSTTIVKEMKKLGWKF